MECNPKLELNHGKHKRKVNYKEDKGDPNRSLRNAIITNYLLKPN